MTRSIRFRLLSTLLIIVLLAWAVIAVLTYLRANEEVCELFDAHLAQVSRLLVTTARHEGWEKDFEQFQADLQHQEYEYPVVFQAWSGDRRALFHSPGAPALGFPRGGDGYADVELAGESWRALSVSVSDGAYRIVVADRLAERHALVRRFVLKVLKPLLLAIPFILLLVWSGVEEGLNPVRRVAAAIARRGHASLEPVSVAGVPVELQPLVKEINFMLVRLQATLERHVSFTADAAHELRTPLAGLRVQAQLALRATDAEGRRKALAQVLQGVDATNRLVDQLLTLARIDPERTIPSFEAVDLEALAEDVLANLAVVATENGIDVALERNGRTVVRGNGDLLRILLRNLVENAIRYTPVGGQVQVQIGGTGEGPWLAVEDTGPGIPADERQEVFARFHRLPGSGVPGAGLGLSIVQGIARLHGASVALEDRPGGPGLRVLVRFVG